MFNSKQRKIRKFEKTEKDSIRRSLTIQALCALRDDMVQFEAPTSSVQAKMNTLNEMIHEAWAA